MVGYIMSVTVYKYFKEGGNNPVDSFGMYNTERHDTTPER